MKLKLKKYRIKRKLTQEAIAKRMKIDRSMISRYENGISSVTVDHLFKLARILKVAVSDLIPD